MNDREKDTARHKSRTGCAADIGLPLDGVAALVKSTIRAGRLNDKDVVAIGESEGLVADYFGVITANLFDRSESCRATRSADLSYGVGAGR